MDRSLRNTLLIIAGIFCLAIFFFARTRELDARIAKNHIVVCGKILDMRTGKGTNVIFTFELDGKIYEFNKSSPTQTLKDYKNGIVNILIAVEKNNPNNNVILSKYLDYSDFEITNADTINVKCK